MIRILLVEDEPAILEALQLALVEYGLEVHTAANGARALESLALWRPDVVVSDWMMPVMDGGRLAQELRREPALADMPVFLMSALQPPGDLPIDGFLHKPFGVLQLLRLIYRHTYSWPSGTCRHARPGTVTGCRLPGDQLQGFRGLRGSGLYRILTILPVAITSRDGV